MSARDIYAKLIAAGLTHEGTCGLMGNMQAESGMKSNIVQRGMTALSDEEYTAAAAAVAARNMLSRTTDFVCRSSAGRVVQLRQTYDSTIYPGEPETLPAQWGFKWSTDPAKALPFIALATSPYGVGDCCTHGGKTWRSKMTNNVYSPADYPAGWEEVEA